MTRFLYTAIAALLCASMIQAKTHRPVTRMEAEVHAGLTYPLGSYHGDKAQPGGGIGFDIRYNFKNSPWDIGVFVQIDCAEWEFNHRNPNNRSINCGLSGAYNFRQGHKINPFAGIGVGVASVQEVGTWSFYPPSSTVSAFIPKIGVEFLYFLRLNAYCQISRKGYNTFGLSLGLTIGGWPKKNKG